MTVIEIKKCGSRNGKGELGERNERLKERKKKGGGDGGRKGQIDYSDRLLHGEAWCPFFFHFSPAPHSKINTTQAFV